MRYLSRMGPAIVGLGVLSALMVAVSGSAKIDATGLQYLFLFDDGNGETISDSSGNGNDAAFVNDPVWVDGKFGGGLEFDGATAYADTLEYTTPELPDFTLGTWAKPGDSQKQWATFLGNHQEPPTRGVSFEMEQVITNQYKMTTGTAAGWTAGQYPVLLPSDEWSHLVGVREGGNVQIYVDGEPVNGGAIGEDPMLAGTSKVRLGNWCLGTREWAGVLDEAFFFARALSEAEVQEIYKGFSAAMAVSPADKLATSWAGLKADQ